jgi:hypothetical protein
MLELYHDLEYVEAEFEASDPGTSPARLEQLSHAKSQDTRYWVARNPSTPPDTLTRLALDQYSSVRNQAEANPSTPPLVKLWLQLGGFQGMTLEDFLKAAQETS